MQSDWLRLHENPKDAATQRDLRVRARAIATRIIAPVGEEDRLPEAMEQEEAADRAELAQLCGTLAAMDVPIDGSEQRAWNPSQQWATFKIERLPNDANVEALIVNGERVDVNYLAEARQLGEVLLPGRRVDDEDDDEARPDREEDV